MLRLLSPILLFALLASGSFAQSDPGQELLDDQARAVEGATNPAPGNALPAAPEIMPVAEATCFPVKRIELTGVSEKAPRKLNGIIRRFEGRCIGQISIGILINGISATYAEAGYITTRAYIPAQDLKSGVLKIDVLEGRIESFLYQQGKPDGSVKAGPPRKILWGFPGQPGEVFELRDLEHALETMNRLPSSKASANLEAGLAPGTTRIVIAEMKSDPVRGTANFDNTGSPNTGQTKIRFSLEADDLLRLNDSFSLSYSGTENSNALAFSLALPYRYWRFALSGSYSESLSLLTPVSDLFSQTASVSFQAERMIFRDDRRQFSLYGSAGSNWNERYINIVGLTPQHLSTVRFGAKYRHQFETASVTADLSYAYGTQAFGADWPNFPLDLSAPRPDFGKVEGEFSYRKQFPDGGQFSLTAAAQFAKVPLYSNDQFSIGGWDTVRGFQGAEFAGDKGTYLRTEYYLPPRAFGKTPEKGGQGFAGLDLSGQMQAYLFSDIGRSTNIAADKSSTMAGFGLGIFVVMDNVTIQLAAAVPVNEVGGSVDNGIQGFINVSIGLF